MQPYASFVAVSRNDNHGGDLNARSQAFVSGLLNQAERHQVPIELILVEWNPPADRQSLSKEYDWGKDRMYGTARVITVPCEVHDTFLHGKAQPLYQMIGKNVGIRRARGDLIAATNIDIIFDDDFFRKLKAGEFRKGVVYVANRTDIDKAYPYAESMDKQLAYCRSNILRLNTKYGTKNCRTGEYSQIFPEKDSRQHVKELRKKMGFAWAKMAAGYCAEHVKHQVRVNFKDRARHLAFISKRSMQTALGRVPAAEYYGNVAHYLDVRKGHRTFLEVNRSNIRDNLNSLQTHYKVQIVAGNSLRNMVRLHTNACGDFTMTDRKSWEKVHGYAEYDMYSMHIDGLMCWAAYAAGIPQEVLEDVHIYHIEHGAGSGFTPEHQNQLWDRLTARGIPYISWQELDDLIHKLLSGEVDFRLAPKTWGMKGMELPETVL
jgi:hypothetical protein